MATVAVGIADQKARSAAVAGACERALRRDADREHVHAIDGFRRYTEGDATRDRVRPGGDVLDGGEFAKTIVFTHKQHWQPPDRGHVHDLEQQALIERAVAEEGDRHLTATAPLGAQRSAGGERNAAA